MKKEYFIGIMSGTSMDGVDLVLASFPRGKPQVICTCEQSWPEEILPQLHGLCSPSFGETETMGEVSCSISRIFARGVEKLLEKARISPSEVIAIGSHGQTIRHHPDLGYSWQLGCGALLSELTGIDVICDFRSADIAAGGEGAPLVPAFHNWVFRHPGILRFIVNIGGIANVSVLDPEKKQVIGFDTGPGNTLLDCCTRKFWHEPCDKDAFHARQGAVNRQFLQILLQHPYLARSYPKSTGRETFTWEFVEECLRSLPGKIKEEDILRTLSAYTSLTIAREVCNIAGTASYEVYICGGGSHNPVITEDLNTYLRGCCRLGDTGLLGADPDFVEALAFAWLAYRFTARLPGNLPEATGAYKPKILGCLYPSS
ncbi:MAG: anhydro-N-acetylmuramic acid kinase [Succinivibrionaceae bacterium]